MNKENDIQIYLNTHNCNDNRVFTWCLYNYDKLKTLVLDDRIRYFDSVLFKDLEKTALNDKFIDCITNNGKFRACVPTIVEYTRNGREVAEKEINWNEP